MFEPMHGAAFGITDQSKVNHLTTTSAVAMLLEHLGESAAGRVNAAVLRDPNERVALTTDLDGTASNQQVGDTAATCRNE